MLLRMNQKLMEFWIKLFYLLQSILLIEILKGKLQMKLQNLHGIINVTHVISVTAMKILQMLLCRNSERGGIKMEYRPRVHCRKNCMGKGNALRLIIQSLNVNSAIKRMNNEKY